MKYTLLKQIAALSWGVALLVLAAGCGQQVSENESSPVAQTSDQGEVDEGHDHGGWWCNEHGVPEEECSMCSAKAADEFKAKGDWCEEHNRAESQCFICHPEKAEKFAKLYEAKVGHLPPKREVE